MKPGEVGTGENHPRQEMMRDAAHEVPLQQLTNAAVLGNAVQQQAQARPAPKKGGQPVRATRGAPCEKQNGQEIPEERRCRVDRPGEARARELPRQLSDAVAVGGVQSRPAQRKTPVPGDMRQTLPPLTGMPEERQGAIPGDSNPVEETRRAENSTQREEPLKVGTPPKAQAKKEGQTLVSKKGPRCCLAGKHNVRSHIL